jgi:hypothetical protein
VLPILRQPSLFIALNLITYARILNRTTCTSHLLPYCLLYYNYCHTQQENALAISACLGEMGAARVPFVIDPASAATNWLKTFLSK